VFYTTTSLKQNKKKERKKNALKELDLISQRLYLPIFEFEFVTWNYTFPIFAYSSTTRPTMKNVLY